MGRLFGLALGIAVLLPVLVIVVMLSVLASLAGGSCQTGATVASGPASVTGVPAQLLPLYVGAAGRYGLGSEGWSILAAINYVESDFGQNLSTSSAGAVGWMQFEPGTWAQWRVTPSGALAPNGSSGWNDPGDAIYTAARYLQASGAPGDWNSAIFAYNHADWYVRTVESDAAQIRAEASGQTTVDVSATSGSDGCAPNGPSTPGRTATLQPNGLAAIPASAPVAVQQMLAAGNQIITYPYSWGGGHDPASMRIPPGPTGDPGQQENGGPGYDCSSAVSFVLWGAGLGQTLLGGQVPTSWTLETVGLPGGGRWVTIYAGTSGGQGHTFIEVAGLVMDTAGPQRNPAGTGPRWQPASDVQYELAHGSFTPRHPQGL